MSDQGRPSAADRPLLSRTGRAALNFLLVAAATALVVWVLVRLRLVVLPTLLALALATVLWPAVSWLRARGWRPALAAGVVMIAALLLFAGLFAAITPTLVNEFDDVGSSAREGIERVTRWLTEGPLGLSQADIERGVDRGLERLGESGGGVASGFLSGVVLVAELVAGLLLALVTLFFLLKDGPQIRDFLLERLPVKHRSRTAAAAEAGWTTLTGYLRGVAVVALVDSVLIGLALWLLGVPLVVPLMVLTFFGAFVPLVGAVLAGAVAALVALVAQGALIALLVVLVIVVIQQVEGDVLYPAVVGRAVELHPLVVLLGLTAGAVTAGVVGALLAVPAIGTGWSGWTAWQSSR